MSTRKTKRSVKPRRAKTSRSVREDGAPLSIRNSGLEVWLEIGQAVGHRPMSAEEYARSRRSGK